MAKLDGCLSEVSFWKMQRMDGCLNGGYLIFLEMIHQNGWMFEDECYRVGQIFGKKIAQEWMDIIVGG